MTQDNGGAVEHGVSDLIGACPPLSSERVFAGHIWDVVRESFEFPHNDEPLTRDFIDHPGAVSMVVLDDEQRILLQRQYRHPVGMRLWEIPAGLMDVDGEPPVEAAARELAEEADLVAESWHVLADLFNSPGSSTEAQRVFIARGLSPVPEHERHERTGEEADLETAWVPLEEAVAAVMNGRIHNPSAVVGILAAHTAAATGFAALRDAHAAWDEHPRLRP
ncbi:NUDIX domain-containing protein [Zhihengliuella salsuginis]|uniref:ADP-ribose pyrophosphatase n=1 Tax=Zhihengliuella salsuginis TaxID=578222 RepID=A0ABQ3GIJ7_9MICC|nr:NUDIX hydrolase [Zhihengliuella salsuginis]GHD08947.1 ADP-ribose pyrophosphatase [Zhihengliuella salsuginis]